MSQVMDFIAEREDGRVRAGERQLPTVLLMGNPNVGKTSLFNRLAQRQERVGNYPGVTVERRSARVELAAGGAFELVDVPGAYSLSARSSDEQIALHAAVGWGHHPKPELVVLVVDAGQALRNLYLGLQLMELGVPLVIALNMMDEAGPRAPDPKSLASRLGVPCIGTSARDGAGVPALLTTIGEALRTHPRARVLVRYPAQLRQDMDHVAEGFPRALRGSVEHDRALALWALSSLEPDDELLGVPDEVRRRTAAVHAGGECRDIDHEIVGSRYRWLEELMAGLCSEGSGPSETERITERIDRVVLHPAYGFALFLAVMFLVFQSLFAGAEPFIGWIEAAVAWLAESTRTALPDGIVRDLITEGVIGGVGNVLVFLPQIVLLFFFIGILEDSGYMARVAYLMDRALRVVGLHGRAFVPMMSGFACAVPAILATRTMERRRDRLLTMLVVPLMSCSARLPVYTLIIGALFAPVADESWLPLQSLLLVAMYVFSTCMALLVAFVLGRTAVRGRSVPLILELPPYRLPSALAVVKLVLQRARGFLTEAGTVILAFTIVMWGLLSFPRIQQSSTDVAAPAAVLQLPQAPASQNAASGGSIGPAVSAQVQQSYAGKLGHLMEPVLEPIGLDWKMGIGIVGAFAAREVFVSTLGLVYGVDADADEASLRQKLSLERRDDGTPAYTPLVGLSLMVFFALACQCMSTLAVVRRETGGWRWPAFLFGYMTTLAWSASFLVFQVGRLLGF